MPLFSVRIRPGSRTELRASRRGGSLGSSLSRLTVRERPGAGDAILGDVLGRQADAGRGRGAAAGQGRHDEAENDGLAAGSEIHGGS